MKISETIHVARSPEEVWELFQDVPELARCLPGAELTEDRGGGTYAGKVGVKLGPLSATFEGEATVSSDHDSRSGTVDGKGTDRRGGSRGQVKVEYHIGGEGTGSVVTVDADVHLSGAVAQFGRTGLIKELSARLIEEFVECVEAKLEAATPEAAAEVEAGEVRGISLFISSAVSAVVRFFKRLVGSK